MSDKTRVLILGGGFGGLYAALEFEKRNDPRFEVTVVNRENFFLFTPMLHEIAASDLWRGIYWSKLPRAEKKVRVAIDWALDVFFSKDFVQYLDQRAMAASQTETGAAPWNRDQLSDPIKNNNRMAA
jgi:NADH dehydrogenase FAD-containing subunit